jgi:alpha-tubulin suppressor-like RCC1 family protein
VHLPTEKSFDCPFSEKCLKIDMQQGVQLLLLLVLASVRRTSTSPNFIAWGNNNNGQIGDGTSGTNRLSPVSVDLSRVLPGATITSIFSGAYHNVLLTSTGQAYAWGYNNCGQIGDGTIAVDRLSAVSVDTTGVLKGKIITNIASGGFHTVALSSVGQVYAWGLNNQGQIGDGTSGTNRLSPISVDTTGALNGKIIINIAAGAFHTIALSSSGQLYAWGSNDQGQIGDGTNVTYRLSPVSIATNGKVFSSVSAGAYYSMALSLSGQVYAWGNNNYGQIGDGTYGTNRLSPVPVDVSGVLNGKRISAIGCGLYHATAVSSTGSVYTWGVNDQGQIGDGSIIYRFSPVLVAGLLSGKIITNISCGGYHNTALSSAGQAYTWGNNNYGQIGDGTSGTNRLSPVYVDTNGALNSKMIISVATGYYHVIALTASPATTSSASPTTTSTALPTTTSTSSPTNTSVPDYVKYESGFNFDYLYILSVLVLIVPIIIILCCVIYCVRRHRVKVNKSVQTTPAQPTSQELVNTYPTPDAHPIPQQPYANDPALYNSFAPNSSATTMGEPIYMPYYAPQMSMQPNQDMYMVPALPTSVNQAHYILPPAYNESVYPNPYILTQDSLPEFPDYPHYKL